ncbi:MAG: fatty acid desaturase [Hahellaceae bacterium]|nr:fatty acid desaturase [Hahellaceae bacterium]
MQSETPSAFTQEKAPVNWPAALIFAGTFAVTVSLVPLYGYYFGYDAVEWFAFIVMLALCGFSITAGYHRLWSHKTYEAHIAVRYFWAFWGACSLQNTILAWSSGHRRHHRHVDSEEKDPYSIRRGFWFAHMGWMLRNYKSGEVDLSNVADLQRDPVVMWQQRHYAKLVLISNVGVPVALGLLNGDVLGMFLLAGFLRLVISHHVTFFINSLCHMWGRQPYTDTNTARDNPLLALVTYGEGYHNFHHFFQTDYRNGVRWWQFDPTKWIIFGMSWVGLTTNLKRVPDFKIQEAVVNMQFKCANDRLKRAPFPNMEGVHELLEKEYQQFMDTLAEWKRLRIEWYEDKRKVLVDTKEAWQGRFQQAAVKYRIKEVEYMLKMQQKRLNVLLSGFGQAQPA